MNLDLPTDYLRDAADALVNGSLTIVVGAGLSMTSSGGYPSWNELYQNTLLVLWHGFELRLEDLRNNKESADFYFNKDYKREALMLKAELLYRECVPVELKLDCEEELNKLTLSKADLATAKTRSREDISRAFNRIERRQLASIIHGENPFKGSFLRQPDKAHEQKNDLQFLNLIWMALNLDRNGCFAASFARPNDDSTPLEHVLSLLRTDHRELHDKNRKLQALERLLREHMEAQNDLGNPATHGSVQIITLNFDTLLEETLARPNGKTKDDSVVRFKSVGSTYDNVPNGYIPIFHIHGLAGSQTILENQGADDLIADPSRPWSTDSLHSDRITMTTRTFATVLKLGDNSLRNQVLNALKNSFVLFLGVGSSDDPTITQFLEEMRGFVGDTAIAYRTTQPYSGIAVGKLEVQGVEELHYYGQGGLAYVQVEAFENETSYDQTYDIPAVLDRIRKHARQLRHYKRESADFSFRRAAELVRELGIGGNKNSIALSQILTARSDLTGR